MSDETTGRTGSVEFGPWRTWYRVSGGGAPDAVPLIVIHGGPGCTHDYLLSLTDLATPERPVVHYDQIGNGRSTHLPDRPAGEWTAEFFMAELQNLVDRLGFSSFDLLGQSWGGMLAAQYATGRPAGLRRLVIANSPAAMRLWIEGVGQLRADLPEFVQETLTRHERAGTTGSAEYRLASEVFYARHVCRLAPWPEEVVRTFAQVDADPTVYHTMNGVNEFHVTGTLRDWSVVDDLPRIAVPTLLVTARHDEAAPVAYRPFLDRVPDCREAHFAHSSHMPHVEERERFMASVAAFLDTTPAPA
ncbi:proline iminopeptidase-family hydrolase [Streptomyces paludis]|uniref:Proline iminopeptidase n=1 Tax=Streptomyces paludis TaxID=2282738 RepID=A0A345HI79_9ACTN|nr:proline iminopeptidase-family hydrolase [Streptomyces paludis]AXG76403.1 alpha/beta fold hydrolase [Streptomyces paludis]